MGSGPIPIDIYYFTCYLYPSLNGKEQQTEADSTEFKLVAVFFHLKPLNTGSIYMQIDRGKYNNTYVCDTSIK